MSELLNHAQRELNAAGVFDDDSDYNGALSKAVMELVEVFSKQHHSGASAAITLSLFNRVADFKNLTPLTNNAAEWVNISDMSNHPMWQNKRRGTTFSRDGGKT